jgi:hypothetical protein
MKHFHVAFTTLALLCALGGAAAAQRAMKNPHEKLSRPCESCHTAVSFHDVRFDHNVTDFPLEGRHQRIACLSCHLITDFSTVDGECIACHEDLHLGKLGVACEECHISRAWNVFDAEEIHSRSNFPLMGRHVLVDCAGCHHGQLPANFNETPTECVACHRMDYMEASRPNHVAGGFHSQCEQCHTFSSWRPGMMPDHEPLFPIFSGTHKNRWNTCTECHTDPGNYNVFNCLTCHRRPETDGAHVGMTGYVYDSPQCYACHPDGRAGRFAEHDAQFFPIYSGAHSGRWNACSTCHPDAGNASNFDCLGCHEHDRTRMDDKHLGEVGGYVYASSACFDCHPDGRKE